MKKKSIDNTFLFITGSNIKAQTVSRNIRTKEYRELRQNWVKVGTPGITKVRCRMSVCLKDFQ